MLPVDTVIHPQYMPYCVSASHIKVVNFLFLLSLPWTVQCVYIYIYICICIFMSKWTTYLLTVITSLFLFVGQLTLSSSSLSSAQNLTTGEASCCTECRRRLHAVIVVFCFLLFIAAVCKSSYFIYLLLPTKLGSSGCCRSCLCVCVSVSVNSIAVKVISQFHWNVVMIGPTVYEWQESINFRWWSGPRYGL